MKDRDYHPHELRLMKALGLEIDGQAIVCSGRKGVVYLKRDGQPVCIAHDRTTGKPTVCECEHNAFDLTRRYLIELSIKALGLLAQGIDPGMPPEPEDFIYAYIEEEDDEDEEIESLDDAIKAINAVKA